MIASGSLLGVNYRHVSSFPVGYVTRMTLYPLDFEEFLWGIGVTSDEITKLHRTFLNKVQVSNMLHKIMMERFKQFIVIGGMPAVVSSYIANQDYNDVFQIQRDIVTDYKSDIAKYANKTDKVKARECFESIPFQLGKDNKKFQYKYVSKVARSSTYDGSIQWLIDAGIIYKCSNLTALDFPLETYKRVNSFKLYLSDTGLLISMLGKETQRLIVQGDLGVSKGAIYENIIGVILKEKEYSLFYFDKLGRLELDFIIYYKNQLTAIEVKSADNTKAKSLVSFYQNYNGKFGIKLSSKNVYSTENELRLPIYFSMFI